MTFEPEYDYKLEDLKTPTADDLFLLTENLTERQLAIFDNVYDNLLAAAERLARVEMFATALEDSQYKILGTQLFNITS
jgi:hypothetical protein